MAKGDVKIVDSVYSSVPTRTYKVDDRTTSGASATIKPGEPVKKSGNFVIALATGDPEIGTDLVVGIAKSESTETSSADGTIEVYRPLPGIVYRTAVTTPANIDTAAELLGILNDSVTYDLTTGTYTVDEDEGDDPDVHGLIIIDGNTSEGTVDYIFNQNCVQGGGTI